MSAPIELHDLRRCFGARVAVDGITHRFAPGRITTLVGPSGSGKSTTLALIAGLLEPDAGSVHCDGEDITALAAERRGFGVVFQSYALFPHLNVRRNVEFGLRARGVGRAERAREALQALARVRVEQLADRRVDQLSGGEQQRVALARALVLRPKLLMLDEPLSAVDAALRDDLRQELAELLPGLGVTAIHVTHDREEALQLGHELVVMRAGRIEQAGPPAQVYAQPRSAFVASFLGAANVLPGRCRIRAGCARLELGFAELALKEEAPEGPCWAVLRPGDLELVASGTGDFDARVDSSLFLGDRTRAQLGLRGASLWAEIARRGPQPQRGETVGVRVDVARLHRIPRTEEAP